MATMQNDIEIINRSKNVRALTLDLAFCEGANWALNNLKKEENENLKKEVNIALETCKEFVNENARLKTQLQKLKTIFELAPDMYQRELSIINQ